MHDPNSGSTASLHESEHPHLGRDSVLDIHNCPFRAHLQTSSPHMFLSVMLMEEPSSPGYYFRGSSHTSLLMICWQNEQGEPAAKNSILKSFTVQVSNQHTSAILFDSGQLCPDNELRKLRLLLSSLWLGAPRSKPQHQ